MHRAYLSAAAGLVLASAGVGICSVRKAAEPEVDPSEGGGSVSDLADGAHTPVEQVDAPAYDPHAEFIAEGRAKAELAVSPIRAIAASTNDSRWSAVADASVAASVAVLSHVADHAFGKPGASVAPAGVAIDEDTGGSVVEG